MLFPKRNQERNQYAYLQNELRANLQMSNVMLGIAVCLTIIWFTYIFGGFATMLSPATVSILIHSISLFLIIIGAICGDFFPNKSWSKYILLTTLLVFSGFIMTIDVIFSLFFFAATIVVCYRYFNAKLLVYVTLASLVALFVSNMISLIAIPIFYDSNTLPTLLLARLDSIPEIEYISELFLEENKELLSVVIYRFFLPEALGALLLGFIGIMISIDGGKILSEQKMVVEKNAQTEIDLTKSQTLLTISQIQPHFLFNALNSIYHLCAKDLTQAQEAIDSFATYLRMNIDTLSNDNLVPFEKELEHIQIYLSLEKIRFEERLNTIFNIEEENFLVPPLTIQPIVENAVKHGVCKKPDKGTISISTFKTDSEIVITITDDGPGFDVNAPLPQDGRDHVGLINIRKRLELLVNARVEINSIISMGTTVSIFIPIEQKGK